MSNARDRIREISLETSAVALRNIAMADHSGLVTLKMERGVVRRVWCGTEDGLLVWKDGRALCHIVGNVEVTLVHGG